MSKSRNKAYFVCSNKKYGLKDNKFVIKNKKENNFESERKDRQDRQDQEERIIISKCLYV
jgi:hypothetical protein